MTGLRRLLTASATIAALSGSSLASSTAHADDHHRGRDRVQRVLLLSVEGLHAADLEICVAKGTCPNLAGLTEHASTYTNASTTKPSDSFPGLLAQVTGGTSKTTGVFYDDSYDRTLFELGSNCTVGPGTE
jgi:hypothetical protein